MRRRGEGAHTWRSISDDELTSEMVTRLVVSNDRLFLMHWVWQSDSALWMHEIIDGSLCEEGLRIITVDLAEGLFDERWHNLISAVPILHCDGSCSCVVFVSKWSGRVWTYDLARQTVDFFPADPASENRHHAHYYPKFMCYWGMHMHLNLRNMLSWHVEDRSIHLEYHRNELELDLEKHAANLLRSKSIWLEYHQILGCMV